MFTHHKRDLPHVEKHILDMLGPRELVKAKQVCKRWATAVRRYVGHADATRISDLMEMAFFEPVPIYGVLDLGQTVRDLTVNENKEVYVLHDYCVVQLDTKDFYRNKGIFLGYPRDPSEQPSLPRPRRGIYWAHLNLYCSSDGCKFEVEGFYNWMIYEYKKSDYFQTNSSLEFVSRRSWREPEGYERNAKVVDARIVSKTSSDPQLRQSLQEKLGLRCNSNTHTIPMPIDVEQCSCTPLIELGSDIYLVSVPNPKKPEKETLVAMLCKKDNSVTMKLIAKIRMNEAKIRVIGTRVYCYENGTRFRKPSNHVIIFDVWNPMSLEWRPFMGAVEIKPTNIRRSKTVKPLETEENCISIWKSLL